MTQEANRPEDIRLGCFCFVACATPAYFEKAEAIALRLADEGDWVMWPEKPKSLRSQLKTAIRREVEDVLIVGEDLQAKNMSFRNQVRVKDESRYQIWLAFVRAENEGFAQWKPSSSEIQ